MWSRGCSAPVLEAKMAQDSSLPGRPPHLRSGGTGGAEDRAEPAAAGAVVWTCVMWEQRAGSLGFTCKQKERPE